MQWFVDEQVEEEATMEALLQVAERVREYPMMLEEFLARDGDELGGDYAHLARSSQARRSSGSYLWRLAGHAAQVRRQRRLDRQAERAQHALVRDLAGGAVATAGCGAAALHGDGRGAERYQVVLGSPNAARGYAAAAMPSKLFQPGLLDGQVAIVSGGGSGLGRASALELAALGARVVVCGRRQEPLEETAAARRGGRSRRGPATSARRTRSRRSWTVCSSATAASTCS